MSDGESPLTLRRRLRTELREARLRTGLTQDQVAAAMGWSLAKMNRIERAKSGINVNDLTALLRFYDITDSQQAGELFALARAARQSPWWSRYRKVAPPKLLELIDCESAAAAVSQFEVVQFEDAPDENIVFLESTRGDFISAAPEETQNYLAAFGRITQAALGPSDSVGRLLEAASAMA